MSSAHLAWLSTGSTLSTTVVIFPAYGHLRHHDSEIMDGGGIGRGDAGAVGVVVAQRQGADQALVPAGPHGHRGRAVSRRALLQICAAGPDWVDGPVPPSISETPDCMLRGQYRG